MRAMMRAMMTVRFVLCIVHRPKTILAVGQPACRSAGQQDPHLGGGGGAEETC